ncbi:unnamed protein product, partial [Urochloa humidicola]
RGPARGEAEALGKWGRGREEEGGVARRWREREMEAVAAVMADGGVAWGRGLGGGGGHYAGSTEDGRRVAVEGRGGGRG